MTFIKIENIRVNVDVITYYEVNTQGDSEIHFTSRFSRVFEGSGVVESLDAILRPIDSGVAADNDTPRMSEPDYFKRGMAREVTLKRFSKSVGDPTASRLKF